MHSIQRSLRVARALALGSTLSGTAACDSHAAREDPAVEVRQNSGGAASVDAGTAVATHHSSDASAPAHVDTPVVENSACDRLDQRGEMTTGRGIYPCRCVATHTGNLVWDCNHNAVVVEGPLPPPELAALA
ncbi:MAG: hypothetical protein Q8Q09_11160 [Deltaproteobacteria bacterium]|nr:hypothetical protein [Deltaproteobacteria bacterium]